MPAPVLSPLAQDYVNQLESITKQAKCKVEKFGNLDTLLQKLDGLKKEEVYELKGAQ
jgi:hypothetical protein